MSKENDDVTYNDKVIGKVKSIKFIDGKTHYDIEITDKEFIDKIEKAQQSPLSLGYYKKKKVGKRGV